MSDQAPETPEADLAEQQADVLDDEDTRGTDAPGEGSDEVDPADRAEQEQVVGLGDDEYPAEG